MAERETAGRQCGRDRPRDACWVMGSVSLFSSDGSQQEFGDEGGHERYPEWIVITTGRVGIAPGAWL